MPRRRELLASALLATISCGMSRIDDGQVRDAGHCDEIVNNALMKIATGQSSCFQCLEVDVEGCGLESVTYAKRARCLISQHQELKNATVKSSPRENWVPCISPRIGLHETPPLRLGSGCGAIPMASLKSCLASG